jgi:hypothetical protein
VWAIVREVPFALTLSLVTLTGQPDDRWNAPHRPPTPQHDIPVGLPAAGPVKGVWLATPDDGAGRAVLLDFEQLRDRVTFSVPTLDRWDLVVVEYAVWCRPGSLTR